MALRSCTHGNLRKMMFKRKMVLRKMVKKNDYYAGGAKIGGGGLPKTRDKTEAAYLCLILFNLFNP